MKKLESKEELLVEGAGISALYNIHDMISASDILSFHKIPNLSPYGISDRHNQVGFNAGWTNSGGHVNSSWSRS